MPAIAWRSGVVARTGRDTRQFTSDAIALSMWKRTTARKDSGSLVDTRPVPLPDQPPTVLSDLGESRALCQPIFSKVRLTVPVESEISAVPVAITSS